MKQFLSFIAVCLLAFSGIGATIQWYSQQPVTTTPRDTDVMVLETTGPQGYKSFTLLTLKNWLGTNGASTLFIPNLYASNIFVTNFNGKLVLIENLFGSNAYITNLYSSNAYITNLTVNEFHGKTTITTNLYSSNAFFTNLFVINSSTNYFLFPTNIYISNTTNNTYVSNYFQTNVFQNTYMSNFFSTNLFLYQTNIFQFSTNLTVTNFYAGNTIVSNFFNTNIFNVDNSVSNFFSTNIYNTINIQSNYFVQLAAPLTNATLWGTTTFAPESGNASGLIQMYSNGIPTLKLSADGSYLAANSVLFHTNRWDGPTNNWPMLNGEEQYYVTFTDVNVTNFSLLPPTGYGWNGLLVISNAASTNITWRFISTLGIPERTTSVTVSNASKGMMSGKWSTATGTNGVYRQF